MVKYKILDLFCGCGGLSLGFKNEGFDIIAGIDNWQDALLTFKKNHINSKSILADLNISSADELIKNNNLGDIDIIIGGPPCQGFSIAGKRNSNDERNSLYLKFADFLRELQPRVFVMENVPNLASIDKGRLLDKITNEFKEAGYHMNYKIMNSSFHGVPQIRKRIFLVGTKGRNNFSFPLENDKLYASKIITSKEAISDLPNGTLENGTILTTSPRSEYQKKMRERSKNLVFNHQITLHTEKTKQIISLVPDGGNYKDLPKHLQNTRKVNIAWTRLNSKKPSFTIDTGHNHHFHYKFNRVPTVRESARIQSFPDSFVFEGNKTSQLKQVGNAVPPLLSKSIAKQVRKLLP